MTMSLDGFVSDEVGSYEFQTPIFLLTHHRPATPPRQDERLTFTFVQADLESVGQRTSLRFRVHRPDW